MKNWFLKLSPVMQIVIIVILIVLVWQIWKMGKESFFKLKKNMETNAEEAALIASGQSKSYSSHQYTQMANQLYAAMKGAGTDYNSVGSVFAKMKNDLDVIELDKKFGMREGTTWYGGSKMYSMQEWLRGDLSSSNMEKYVNGPMRKKGITIQY